MTRPLVVTTAAGHRGSDAVSCPIEVDRSHVATEKLDLLILKTLAPGSLHGYGIGRRIEQVSQGVFRVTLGALYPALQRLERVGAITAEWALSENNRRARYYTLTRVGHRRLATEAQAWERVAEAMTRVLQTDPE